MYGYNAGPPMTNPIYTVLPYCVISTALYKRKCLHVMYAQGVQGVRYTIRLAERMLQITKPVYNVCMYRAVNEYVNYM